MAMSMFSKEKSDSHFSRSKGVPWQPSCSDILQGPSSSRMTRSGEFGKNFVIPEMRILLVEDHPESRGTLQRLIERRSHEVVAVGSSEEAELELGKQFFPFLILDWMLPGKSGVELCRELRAAPNGDEFFILLVTARDDPQALEQALEAGANDYLIKPLDSARLNVRLSVAERRIRALIERNQARAELQETVRKMTDILEKTNDGFFAVDRDWKFTFVNPQAETLLERRREDLIGKDFWIEFPEFTRDVFGKNYRRAMSEQVAIEFEASDASGQVWFELLAYPSGGGVSVFLRDVTDRKRVEQERLTTSKLESLGTLAGGIAHDLNNILTVISGNIGLAQIEAPGDSTNMHSFLSRAGEAAQHAAQLSNQLLTFSKGGTPLKRVASISDLVTQAAEFSLHGSNLRADLDIPDELWRSAVDPVQIEQVINALIINAREAMPHGGTVRVSAGNLEIDASSGLVMAPGRYVKVQIADNGGGIDAKSVSRIFDPYFTTKPSATGLGLSISYSVVKKHGGLLQLENTSPDGSTFAFYLPATDAEPQVPESTLADEVFSFNHQRVLVMDDEAAIRDLTSELLATLGYKVTTVPDGAEALKTYELAMRAGENFEAVILDATIRGGMGGVATIERLRDLDPNVRAIICSGYSDEAALAEFLTYGFRAALPKPFTRHELANVLQRAFEAGKV
jgi:two-component system, cell cycle sensor histidine kinase and response regulator CckA